MFVNQRNGTLESFALCETQNEAAVVSLNDQSSRACSDLLCVCVRVLLKLEKQVRATQPLHSRI